MKQTSFILLNAVVVTFSAISCVHTTTVAPVQENVDTVVVQVEDTVCHFSYDDVIEQKTLIMRQMVKKRDSLAREDAMRAEQKRIAERKQQEEEYGERMCETNVSSSGNLTRSSSRNYSDAYSTIFNSAFDVIAYTSSNRFRDPYDGSVVVIREEALYVDGQALTGAPEVLNFRGSIATIRVHSPYLGGGALTIFVDAYRGTITDGAGDVYYKVR